MDENHPADLTHQLLSAVNRLSAENQRRVLAFVESLEPAGAPPAPDRPHPPRNPLLGCLSHLGVTLTEEELAAARKGMWGNFPRPFPEPGA